MRNSVDTRHALAGSLSQTITLLITLVCAGPSARGNHITDGASFEVGLDGCSLGITAGRFHAECASVSLEPDRSTAADGLISLKFVRPLTCRNHYALLYKPVALSPGRSYTLSAYLKCAEPNGTMMLALFGFAGQQEQPPRRYEVFQLTSDWRRYHLAIADLAPSIPVEGDPGHHLYYVALQPGLTGSSFWIDGVQLEEGQLTAFHTDKPLELSLSSNRPGNQFWAGEPIVLQAQAYAAKPAGRLGIAYRAVDLLGAEVASGSMEVAVPPDGHVAAELPAFSVPGRAWLTIEVTASCGGQQEKEYLCVAVIQKTTPPIRDQRCQFGFNYNAVASPDDFGRTATWAASNMHLNLDRVFRLASQVGAQWHRVAEPLLWEGRPGRSCETAPGQFTFYDDALATIKTYGFDLMGTLGNANARESFCPKWAESGRTSRLAPIPTVEAWRRYVRTMVEHYRHHIRTWEIINEPNTAFWPQDYLPLLAAAYEEAKAADPNCTVVGICATADQEGDPYGYVRAVAEAGGLAFLDVISGHTFCKVRPWQSRSEAMSWDYMTQLLEIAKQHAPAKDLGLWNTEGIKYGAWDGRPNLLHTTPEIAAARKNRNMILSQPLAAAYAVRDCIIEFCSGARVLFLWEFRQSIMNANIAVAGGLGSMDFFAADGTPQAKFVALNALADKLRGAAPVEHFGLSPQVRCAVFDAPSGAFAVLWRENQDETDLHSYTVPLETAVEVQDMLGRPVKPDAAGGNLEVQISETPVFVLPRNPLSAQALAAAIKDAARHVRFAHDRPLVNPFPIRPRPAPRVRGAARWP